MAGDSEERFSRGKMVTLFTETSFIVNKDIVNGNIVKWGTKQFLGTT